MADEGRRGQSSVTVARVVLLSTCLLLAPLTLCTGRAHLAVVLGAGVHCRRVLLAPQHASIPKGNRTRGRKPDRVESRAQTVDMSLKGQGQGRWEEALREMGLVSR